MSGGELFATRLAGGLIGGDGSGIVLAEWRDPGGREPPQYIAPLHVHYDDDEAWYVLEARSWCGAATATSRCRPAAP